jgi:hypothetical protein
MTRNEKAVAQLNKKDFVSGCIENDAVYLVVEDNMFELAEFEIAFQANEYDKELEDEI